MKKLLPIIAFIFSTFFAANAQSYSLQLSNSDLNCYLDIFGNGKYLIKLSYKNAPDLMMSQVLSFGEYKVETNGDYLLTDATNNYNITLQPVSGNKVFMVNNGFKWMEMNYFVRNSEKPSSPQSILDDFLSNEELLNYRKKLKIENDTRKFTSSGVYKSDFNPNFTLHVNQNGNYSVRFYSLELSSGTWLKENNFLKLRDNNLACDFFALIDTNGKLKSVLIPGDFFMSNFTKAP